MSTYYYTKLSSGGKNYQISYEGSYYSGLVKVVELRSWFLPNVCLLERKTDKASDALALYEKLVNSFPDNPIFK